MPGRQPGGGPPGNGGRICRQIGHVWLLLDRPPSRQAPSRVQKQQSHHIHLLSIVWASSQPRMHMAVLSLTPGGGMPGGGIPGRGGMP